MTTNNNIIEMDNENDNMIEYEDNMPILSKYLRGTTYLDILIYNGLKNENQDLTDSLDKLAGIFEKLFDYGLTLSGFQFVGLILENSLSNHAVHVQVAYFLLSLGFMISMLGALLSFIAFEYISSIREEKNRFIIQGIQKYKCIFRLSEVVLYFNSCLFIIPINILIYNVLEIPYGIAFNIVSLIFCIIGLLLHYLVIIRKQIYVVNGETFKRIIYEDKKID